MTSGNTKLPKAKAQNNTAADETSAEAAKNRQDGESASEDAGKGRRGKYGRGKGQQQSRRAEPEPVAAPKQPVYDVEDDTFDIENEPAEDPNVGQLHLKISRALYHKMKYQAREEGISLEEFAIELLSEGVVLRAWEIVEKKNQLRGGNPNQPSALPGRQGQHNGGRPNHGNHGNHNNHNNHNNNMNHRKNGNRNGMSQSRYQSIMDDKATFLEYVRNQERNRR